MTTYAGWEGVFILEGDQTKEVIFNTASADEAGASVEIFTKHWPIVDDAGDVTDDETDIVVYEDGVALNNNGTTYTLDGSEGSITIVTVTEDKRYTVSYKSKETVGSWKDIDVETKNNLKRVHVGGQRNPIAVKEGLLEHGLKFVDVLLDSRRMDMAHAELYPELDLPAFTATIQTKSSGGVQYELTGVKLDTSKLTLKHDDITGTEVNAIPLAVSVSTT